MWIRHDAPQALQDAQNLVVRMSNSNLSRQPQPKQALHCSPSEKYNKAGQA